MVEKPVVVATETVWNMPIGQLRWYSAAFLKISGTDVPFWTPQDEEQYKRHLANREQMLAERTGASKHNSWIDYSVLEGCLREDLEDKASRAMAVQIASNASQKAKASSRSVRRWIESRSR